MIDFSKPWPLGLNGPKWPLPVGAALVIFLVLLAFDHPISVFAAAQSPSVVSFFNWVSRWGESDWILIPSALLLITSAIAVRVAKRRLTKLALIESTEIFAFIFVGVALPSLISNILKRLIGRGRPPVFDKVGELSFHPFANDFFFESFPSGHTTTAFSLAFVVALLVPRWYWLGLIYAIAVGLSRLVLGVHYPTDVFGGLILGTLGAYWVRDVFARRRWGFERLPNGLIARRRPVAIPRWWRWLRQLKASR